MIQVNCGRRQDVLAENYRKGNKLNYFEVVVLKFLIL